MSEVKQGWPMKGCCCHMTLANIYTSLGLSPEGEKGINARLNAIHFHQRDATTRRNSSKAAQVHSGIRFQSLFSDPLPGDAHF